MASDLGRTNGDTAKPPPETTPTTPWRGEPNWVLQTIMELQKSVGELTGAVKSLTVAVTEQSRKIEDCRSELNAKIDARSDKLAQEIAANRGEIAKFTGGLGASRWIVGTLIALAGLLITAISIVLWRLPAIVEALRGVEPVQ